MLGDLITRCLVMVLGYAYPAFQCYKTVEKNRVEIEELRFWCQYWILVSIITFLERFGDIFISWLPMYGEIKLGLFIYLWHPKTKGTGFVYEALLRPYVTKHETDIDRKMLEFRARIWDFAIYYWHNCTELGQSAFFQILDYLTGQSSKFPSNTTERSGQTTPSAPPAGLSSFFRSGKSNKRNSTTPPGSIHHSISETPKPSLVQVLLNSQTGSVLVEDTSIPEQPSEPGSPIPEAPSSDKLHQKARSRLRRF